MLHQNHAALLFILREVSPYILTLKNISESIKSEINYIKGRLYYITLFALTCLQKH